MHSKRLRRRVDSQYHIRYKSLCRLLPVRKKTLVWVGSSKRDSLAMPVALRKDFGVALDIAQQGLMPEGAKLLKGKATGATQLSEDYHGDTYRAVYTVELEQCLYVLHCFQKKSKQGAATPKADIDLIKLRLKAARAQHAQRKG
jgi:phage-related protein